MATYLLRDRFLTDDPAPITTPRTAEPGPGTGTVTDVESVIKILSDRLRGLSQATAVWGDSEIVYDAITRAQGRALVGLVTLEDEAHPIAIGLATSDPGNPTTNGHGWATAADRDFTVITPGKLVTLDAIDRSILTSQYLAIVLLNTQGAVVLLSTFGTMGFLTLNGHDRVGIPAYPLARVAWVEDADTTASLIPYVSALGRGGTTSTDGHAVSDLRVVDVASWSATDALATFVDRFTRADSTTAIGNSWTALSGVWGISSNQAYNVSGSFPIEAVRETGIADCVVSCDITVPADYNGSNRGFGLTLRAVDDSNYLRLWNNNQQAISLQTWVAGGFGATIAQTGFVWTAGQTYRVSCSMKGNRYLIFINGATPLGTTEWQADTNSRFITATKHGLFTAQAGSHRWDNFTVYPHTVTLPSDPFDDGAIPDVTTMAFTRGSDTFTDTSGTSLDAHTAGAGGAWTEHLGNWSIQSNRATVTPVSGNNFATQDLDTSDINLSVDVITPSSMPTPLIHAGVVLRYVDAGNFIIVRLISDAGTGEVEVIEQMGGSGAIVSKCRLPILTTSTTYTLRVRAVGDTIYAFVNGEARLAYITPSGSPVGERHGLYRENDDDGVVFDNWTALAATAASSGASHGRLRRRSRRIDDDEQALALLVSALPDGWTVERD